MHPRGISSRGATVGVYSMAQNKMWAKVGVWSFVAGLVIAAAVAIFSQGQMSNTMAAVLGILGILVGILNVGDDEVQLFLLSSLAFLIAASSMKVVVDLLPGVIADWVSGFLAAVVVFAAPAAFVVSLTALYHVAKDQ